MLAMLNSDYQPITINYKDQTVNLDPECSFNVTWSSGGGQFTANLTKLNQQNNANNIPKPHYKTLAKNELTIKQQIIMPNSYIKYIDCEGENKINEIEYDLDREDLEWLKLINEKRKEKGYNFIDDIVLEKAINLLEKESYFQHVRTGQTNASTLPLTDDDAPCCICNDAEDSNANQIIFCDMCNVAVHQECYGVPYIPEGQWLCRRCQLSPSVVVKCALCPFTTGAFKQTADGRWVHVICAIWINEVHFANTVFLEPVEGVDFALKRRKKLTCIVCKNRMGACLQCSHRSCARSFHVTCAFYAHVRMEIKEMRTKKNPDTIAVNRFVYCHQHSNNCPNTEENVAARKRDIQSKLIQARKRLVAETKKENMSVPIPVIPHNRISQLAATLSIEHFSDVTAYWALKRQSRCGVPLIRRLQVYFGQQKSIEGRLSRNGIDLTNIGHLNDASHVEGHHLESNKKEKTTLMKLALIRREFERVRLLSELVKKRENLKKETLSCDEQLLSMITPVAVLIQRTLEKLIAKDHQEVFMHPVSEEDVPGYRKFITHPMDFCQMLKKFEMGQYKRVADLRIDFLLMMNNCAIFNRDNKYFYDYGQRIRQIGLKVIRAAEAEEARISETLQLIETFITRFELLNSDYLDKLQSELKNKGENNVNVGEHTAKRKIDIFEDSSFKKNNEKQQKTVNIVTNNKIILENDSNNISNNTNLTFVNFSNEKKKQQRSRKRIVNGGKGLNSSINVDDKEKTVKERKKQRTKIKKDVSDESIIILEEKPSTSTDKLDNEDCETKKQTTSPIPATPPRRSSTSRKCKISSVSSTPIQSEQSTVGNKRMRTESNIKISTKSSNSCVSQDDKEAPTSLATDTETNKINGINNKFTQNLSHLELHDCASKQRNKTDLAKKNATPLKSYKSIGRSRKKNFTYSYLTEASSAADEEEDSFDIGDDEDDSFPPINVTNGGKLKNNNKSTKRLRKEIIQNGGNDELYQHNDIVWARLEDGTQMPARVIDLRMRYEFDQDGGLGTHFVQQAINCMPNNIKEGDNKTLVILFDELNTWRWMPNNSLEPCQLSEPNISQLDCNQTVLEALVKARQFWNNVLHLQL